jgi:hypothetical protein
MQTPLKTTLLWLAAAVSPLALAAPGEYWEMSMKMEMAGMPFAMPATTHKVCVAKGSERDPKNVADKDCVMTDLKNSGNKTSWKMHCNNKDGVLDGSGEMMGTPDSSEGTIHLEGTQGGRKFDMTQSYKNKRIGGACETEEMMNKFKGQMCDSEGKDTVALMHSSTYYLDEKMCPGKKKLLCDAVRRDAPRDVQVYYQLVNMEKTSQSKISGACEINIDATTKSICKTFNAKNMNYLTAACPAEAKAYRDNERRRACEGRSYTAKEDLSKCLNGLETSGDESTDGTEDQPQFNKAGGSKKGRSNADAKQPNTANNPANNGGNNSANNPAQPDPAAALIDGAKKLKGLFGF